ncbi:hypothetical protein BGX28_009280 [Mortierella sp. GBA30]|nr:hypothetical protein BGX28_009280 [Mortierella sp. GBA30]
MISRLLIFTFLVSLSLTAQAQVQPDPVSEMAFGRVGSKLYIQGGKQVANDVLVAISSQLFSLDLSVVWPLNAPVWQSLTAGPRQYLINGVVTQDSQNFVTIQVGANNSLIINKYNIPNGIWASSQTVIPVDEYRQGVRPVVDTNTGLIYMNAWSNMDVLNSASLTVTLKPMPPNTFTSRLFSGAAYSKLRRSILYYGGLNGSISFDPESTYVTEYTIGTNTWSNFTTTGTPPVPRSDFCMTANEEGSKIVVYGGRIQLNGTATPPTNFTGTIHVLDVPTGAWTQGPNGVIRSYMACTLVGDQFVAWGGSDGANTLNGSPVVFNISSSQWTTSYIPPAYLAAKPSSSASSGPSAPSSSPPDAAVRSSSNLGAILGGTFGALFVIALSGILYLYLKRKENKKKDATARDLARQEVASFEKPEGPTSTMLLRKSDASQTRNPQKYMDPASPRHPQDSNPQQQHFAHQTKTTYGQSVPSPFEDSPLAATPVVYIPNIVHSPTNALTGVDNLYMTYSPSTTGAITQDIIPYGAAQPNSSTYISPAYTSNVDIFSTQSTFNTDNNTDSSTCVSSRPYSSSSYVNSTPMATAQTAPERPTPPNPISLPQRPVLTDNKRYKAINTEYAE